MVDDKIHLVECPRDAMQGWKTLISTAKKVEYLNALLQVGFHTIDFGSFVSPAAIPQMADTKDVIKALSWQETSSKLLAIVANQRGAEDAVVFDGITYLGFPFSISPTFQQRNTNSSLESSLRRVETIYELCVRNGKQLVIYISMGFGNPYGDPYDESIVYEWIEKFVTMGVSTLSVADTVGLATAEQVGRIMRYLVPQFPDASIGVHLHANQFEWQEKVDAALHAGCLRFDGALKGIGGCPMAHDDLVGNLNTERLISHFRPLGNLQELNEDALSRCIRLADEIFTS